MRLTSCAFRVVVHLACNPGKTMLAKEVASAFHVASGKGVREALRVAVEDGWLCNATGKNGRGNLIRYGAGPRLLKERAGVTA